jgi:hypothetical protein
VVGVGAGGWKSVDEACDRVVKVAKRIQPKRGGIEGDAGRVSDVSEDLSGAEPDSVKDHPQRTFGK